MRCGYLLLKCLSCIEAENCVLIISQYMNVHCTMWQSLVVCVVGDQWSVAKLWNVDRLLQWIMRLPKHINGIPLFSDSHRGQSWNPYIETHFLHIVHSIQLQMAEHKLMEEGHPYKDVAVHSATVSTKGFVSVCIVNDWTPLPGTFQEGKKEDQWCLDSTRDRLHQNYLPENLGGTVVRKWGLDTEGNKGSLFEI